jgi:hypothetical protein
VKRYSNGASMCSRGADKRDFPLRGVDPVHLLREAGADAAFFRTWDLLSEA